MTSNQIKVEVIELYHVTTNTDCTEGRGVDYVNKVALTEATAKRIAKNNYIQGSDSSYYKGIAFRHNGRIYTTQGIIHEPTKEDIDEQKKIDEVNGIVIRMLDAGFTIEEIKAATSNK